jgi:nucleoside 2-deoxyribosyltransferase
MTTKVYLAGPIQHVRDYGKGWRELIKQRRSDFEWVDPMDKYNTMEEAEAEWTETDIVEDDLAMIDDCDGLLVHWEAVPTCGTPMEMFYAARRGKVVAVQTKIADADLSPWLTYHADIVLPTFDGTIEAMEDELND